MRNFRIIPVIDILNNIAVHAIKGERSKYKPLKSHLFDSHDPLDIINILKQKIEISFLYIADLDAIINKNPNYQLLNEISKIKDIDIMIDLGISQYDDILNFLKYRIKYLIVGLETIDNIEALGKIIKKLGNNKIILSIDMYKEKLLTKISSFRNQNPLKIITMLQELGINKIILLDLFKVGQKLGGISPLYLKIRNKFSGDIYVGGGIKDWADIEEFYKNKFSGVLIGTALYDGSINYQKLSNI